MTPPKKKDTEKDEESKKGKGKRAAPDPQPDPSGEPQTCPPPKKAVKRGENKKGDVLTIKKKLEILIEFDQLKHSCKFPEKDAAVGDQHEILFGFMYLFFTSDVHILSTIHRIGSKGLRTTTQYPN